jgi:hypothetical protein
MKTMHATHLGTSLKLFLGILIASCVFSAAANAAPTFVGKFTLPHEVRWGQAVLPPGDYSIRMDSTAAPAKITSASGSMVVFTQSPMLADNEKGGTYLTITNHRVRSLNIPDLGKTVIFAPLSRSEREALAKAGQIEVLPVIVAKK